MDRDVSFNQWMKAHHKEWSEGCICRVCRAISLEDRRELRRLWFRWRIFEEQKAPVTNDKMLQRELELNPDKTNWGMF